MRQSLPVELPRIEQLIACRGQQCVCGACGREKVVIGYETAEQLDLEPAKYFVRVTKREKRACPHCPEQGVACALLAPRIIEKSFHLRTGHGSGTVPGNAVWLGNAGWRIAASRQPGDGRGAFRGRLSAGR